MRKPRSRLRKILFRTILVLFLAGFLWFSLEAYLILKDLPNPERLTERIVAESTKIFDRTGTVLLYEIHGEEKRTVIPLNEIPESMRRATLAAEDIHFYEHGGLDWRGILRAMYINLVSGDIQQGGSTITQQLIKKSLLGDERTFRRKIREQILAVWIERKFSKDKILELYLNQIPYGSNAYGLAAAAETYFGKKVGDLSIAESALLAALPKAPSYYSPYGSHKKELTERKNRILERMRDAGFITKDQYETEHRRTITFAPPKQFIRAPHFVLFVKEYLEEKYGTEFVERGGLRVITTLDWNLQQEAERAVKEGAEANEKRVKGSNAALVAIDPKTGDILSMVGSRDYFGDPLPTKCVPGQTCRFDPHVNVTVRGRQPGSAFKPFVYVTAFKKGYTPETVLFDVHTEFNPQCKPDASEEKPAAGGLDCYHPYDYDRQFRGPVSLRKALGQSLNIPAVKVLYLIGVPDAIATAQTLGITTLTDPSRYGLSLVLGGAEVKPLEMTSAFGAFAQDGTLHQKTAILKIENTKNEILEEKEDSASQVFDQEAVRTLNAILSDNDARLPVFAPRTSMYFADRQVAAKTGTTQDFRDAWIVGYTPSIAMGVWVGNSDNTPMVEGLSAIVAAPIWRRVMDFYLKGTPNEPFPAPSPHDPPDKPILRGVYRSGEIVKIDKISKKRATQYTPLELTEEVSFGDARSILADVRRDDPRGAPPSNPFDDTQYEHWQAALTRWMSLNALPISPPPDGFDDVHTPENQPRISFPQWQEEKPTLPEVLFIPFTVSGAFPLRELSLFIDDELQATKTSPILPGSLSFSLPQPLSSGEHMVKITAFDAVGNSSTTTKTLLIGVPPPLP